MLFVGWSVSVAVSETPPGPYLLPIDMSSSGLLTRTWHYYVASRMRGVPVGIELFRSHVFLVNNRILLYGLSRFLPMGGSTCAIVGCGACNSRHKGLSFHRIPKFGKNKETEEWSATTDSCCESS